MNADMTAPLALAELQNLAPQRLTSYRNLRYSGGDMSVPLERFAPPDQELVQRLYGVLADLLALLQQHSDNLEASRLALQQFAQGVGWTRLLHHVQRLGGATERQPGDILSKVIHDIKGGSLMAISIYLQLFEMGMDTALQGGLNQLVFLTRDHLKMMRNAVQGIDPPAQERDSQALKHDVDLLVEKWHRAAYHLGQRSQGAGVAGVADVIVDCQFAGAISERCREFSALDRVVYNLINNAARHTADGRVYFSIFAVPAEAPRDLRFVIYNQIDDEHYRKLREHYNGNLGDLFRGGFTTGGSGLGMRICTDFVTNAYGLYNIDQALAEGYFGARCLERYFVNWFHWPIAGCELSGSGCC